MGNGQAKVETGTPKCGAGLCWDLTITSFYFFILGKADHGRSCYPEICTWRQQSHHRLMW